MTVEIIEVKQPESCAGRFEVPNTRAQMMHWQGCLIRCNVYFQAGQLIRLIKVELADEGGGYLIMRTSDMQQAINYLSKEFHC